MLGTKEKRKKGKKGEKKESKICDVKSEHFVPSPITTLSLQRPTLSSFTNKHTYTLQVVCFARCLPTYLPHTNPQHVLSSISTQNHRGNRALPSPSPHPSYPIFFFFFSPQEFRLLQGEKRRERKEEKKNQKKSKPTKCLLLLPQALQAPQHQPSQPNTKPALPKYAPRRRPTHSYDYNSSAW